MSIGDYGYELDDYRKYNVYEVAEILKVSTSTVRRLLSTRKLNYIRIAGAEILGKDLAKYIESKITISVE